MEADADAGGDGADREEVLSIGSRTTMSRTHNLTAILPCNDVAKSGVLRAAGVYTAHW